MTQSELIRRRKRYLLLCAGPIFAAVALIGATVSVMARWEEGHRGWPPRPRIAIHMLAYGAILASIAFAALLEH